MSTIVITLIMKCLIGLCSDLIFGRGSPIKVVILRRCILLMVHFLVCTNKWNYSKRFYYKCKRYCPHTLWILHLFHSNILHDTALADPSDVHPSPVGPIYFTFMQFSAKLFSNNRFWGKIRGWHPRLGNPGSATALGSIAAGHYISINFNFTNRQRNYGKVMFSPVSVCHSNLRGVPMWPLPMMHCTYQYRDPPAPPLPLDMGTYCTETTTQPLPLPNMGPHCTVALDMRLTVQGIPAS